MTIVDLRLTIADKPKQFPNRQSSIVNRRYSLLLACAVLVAYAPAFNNGFISDDYVILDRLRALRHDPLCLFAIPPDNFRYTTYICFGLLKGIFGYRPEWFYAFTAVIHIAAAAMLCRYLLLVGGSAVTAGLGALLFAVVQTPQEALMWLSAMNEALLGVFMLGTLLAWLKERYALAALLYVLALFSKESAIALLILLPLTDYCRWRKLVLRRQYVFFLIPALLAAGFYFETRQSNELLTGYYHFGPHGLLVELISLHRLAFPWIYIVLPILALKRRAGDLRELLPPAAWIVVALAPYVFLTYQNHVTSRNQYVACMGFAWLLALLLERVPWASIKHAFVVAFVLVNVAYIWFVKDAQYEERARPTSQLLRELRLHAPDRLLVVNFPLNPWIAKDTALHVPGWSTDMILVNEPPEACQSCWTLKWDARSRSYTAIR